MANWANALTENKLDIAQGGPAIVWSIKDHDIGADGEEYLTKNMDLRGKSRTGKVWEIYYALAISAGTGIPKVYVEWLDANDGLVVEEELSASPTKIFGLKIAIKIKETNSATATYSGIVRFL